MLVKHVLIIFHHIKNVYVIYMLCYVMLCIKSTFFVYGRSLPEYYVDVLSPLCIPEPRMTL